MDAQQLEVVRTFWPVFAGVVGALFTLGVLLWKVANTVSAAIQRLGAVEARAGTVEERLEEHVALEDHPVGKVRRELMAEQLEKLTAGVEQLQSGMARLLQKVGA